MANSERVLRFPASGSQNSERAQCPNCFTMNLLWHLQRKNKSKDADDSALRCALCGTQLSIRRTDSAKAA